jgi:hypothetical protein
VSKASGTFTVTGGNEDTIRGAAGELRVTRVSGRQRFEGEIAGEGTVHWLMLYSPDGSARFAGFQHVEGSIAGRSGSLMMESTGSHDGRSSVGTWRIVPGSGAGELAGIAGHGTFEAPGGAVVSYELEYELG